MKPNEAGLAVGYLNKICAGAAFSYDPDTDRILCPNPSDATTRIVAGLDRQADIAIKTAVTDQGALSVDLAGWYLMKLKALMTSKYLNSLCDGSPFSFNLETFEHRCAHPSELTMRRIEQLSREGVMFDIRTRIAPRGIALWFPDNHIGNLEDVVEHEALRKSSLQTGTDALNQALRGNGVHFVYQNGFLVTDDDSKVRKNAALLREKLTGLEQAHAIKYVKANYGSGQVTIGAIDPDNLALYVQDHPRSPFLSFLTKETRSRAATLSA
jgi:hypothetical protein